jgi:hypothetical protein
MRSLQTPVVYFDTTKGIPALVDHTAVEKYHSNAARDGVY